MAVLSEILNDGSSAGVEAAEKIRRHLDNGDEFHVAIHVSHPDCLHLSFNDGTAIRLGLDKDDVYTIKTWVERYHR